MEAKLDQILTLLNSIDERLPPAVAARKQILGQYGDPKVNFDPKGWKGRSFKGSKASECDADFCDSYAETLEYMARNPKPDADPKYVGYNRKDAKLFRRWAIEKRSGSAPKKDDFFDEAPKKKPKAPDDDFGPPPGDDEIPFDLAASA